MRIGNLNKWLKRPFLPALICCFGAYGFAQNGALDMQSGHVRYLVTHNWTKKMAALDYISAQRRERVEYMWGNDSEWKQYTELSFSKQGSLYFDSEESAEKEVERYAWKKEAYFVRRDFEAEKSSDLIQLLGKVYLVEDSLRCPEWKVLNDLKEVAGHVCMSASWIDTLKDQHIVAWFAMDIPASAGPERTCGLPGLILELDVNSGALIVSADKIDFRPVDAKELALPAKPKGKSIDEAAYQSLIAKHIDDRRKNEDPWFWGVRY